MIYKIPDKWKEIVSGIGWTGLGSGFVQIFNLGISILIARLVSTEEFGELGILKSTITTFSILGGFGMSITATKFIAEFKSKSSHRINSIISLCLVFTLFFSIIISSLSYNYSEIIAEKVLNSINLTGKVKLTSIILLFSSLQGVSSGILNGFSSFKKLSKNIVGSSLISIPFQIILIIEYQVNGALMGIMIHQIIFTLFNIRSIKSEIKLISKGFQFKIDQTDYSIISSFSIPSLLSSLLVAPTLLLCSSILTKSPNGYQEMGYFSLANQMRIFALFIPTTIMQISLPLLSSSGTSKDVKFKSNLLMQLQLTISSALIVSIFIALFSPVIISIFGENYKDKEVVIIIMAISTIFTGVNSILGQVIASSNKMWIGFLSNLIWALSLYYLTSLFINNNLGAVGLALAFLISYLTQTILQTLYIKWITK